MSKKIHPTAIIEDGAKVGIDVTVGAYSIIGKDVELGDGNEVFSHVVISGNTKIGKNNKFFPFASIGNAPQDLKYKGEPTKLEIGDNNTFRESTTMNIGTVTGTGTTKIGSNNLFMALSHVAHDCIVGNSCVFANGTAIAGHVEVQDNVTLGGYIGVVQFLKIGKFAYIGTNSALRKDFPPFFTGKGNDVFEVQSVNSIGLSRRGYSEDKIRKLKNAFKLLYLKKGLTFDERMTALQEMTQDSEEVLYLYNFIKNSEGICL
jgi:UDP-N-acetylglucosamine acyltransferase